LFIVATGSSLDHPAVREAALQFDHIVTTAYGWSRIEGTSLAHKAVVYFNMFAYPRWESKEHDLQPSPQGAGHPKMPLVWSPDGYGAMAFNVSDPRWPKVWLDSVQQFLDNTDCAGVLLDDWWEDHGWWTGMDPKHYKLVHPDFLDILLPRLEEDLETDKIVLLNGTRKTPHHNRYWEGIGQPYNPILRVFTGAKPGDFIYSNTGNARHCYYGRVIAALRRAHAGCGNPDGQPLVDEFGNLRIPLP